MKYEKGKTYFKNIPEIGDLVLDEIFYEDIYPVLFCCRDLNENRYICVCCDIRGAQRWIVSPISNENLSNLIKDKITLKDAFLTMPSRNSFLIEWKPEFASEKVMAVRPEQIPEEDLPIDGEYLEPDKDEFLDYLEILKEPIGFKTLCFGQTKEFLIQKGDYYSILDYSSKNDSDDQFWLRAYNKKCISMILIRSKAHKRIVNEKEFKSDGFIKHSESRCETCLSLSI